MSAAQELTQEICAGIELLVGDLGVSFTLVMWLDGRAADDAAMMIACAPKAEAELVVALRTALTLAQLGHVKQP